MRSKKETDTQLALINEPSAQWGCSRSFSSTRLMMVDTLCVLNVWMCVEFSTTDEIKHLALCGLWLRESSTALFFVFLYVLCMSFHWHVIGCVLLVARLIRTPAVLIAEQCQQSGNNIINGLCECMWTPVGPLFVSGRVFSCTPLVCMSFFILLKVFWFCLFYHCTLSVLCSLQTDLCRNQTGELS